MDIFKTSYEVVKDVGTVIWKCVKYQIKFQNFVSEFEESRTRLQHRRSDIEATLDLQLCFGKIAKEEVMQWVQDVDQKITAKDVEDLISSSGCFCHVFRAKKLDDKTKELNELYERGATYTQPNQILVKDDPSIIVDFVGKFEEAKRRLQHRNDDIESALQLQMQSGKVEKLEVRGWLKNAKEILGAQVDSSSPPQVLKQKTLELSEVYEQGATYSQCSQILVKDDPSIKGVVLSFEKLYARDSVLTEILECLKKDEVRSVAVCGMGGVGKTTIMKKVNDELLLGGSKFKKIIWVTVLKEFNVLKIQNEIASQLKGQRFFKEDQDATLRAGKVSEMLSQKDHLLILDDVWEGFSCEKVGIPAHFGDIGFKFLLTTRFRDVAREMGCKIVSLEPLSNDEALELFLDIVGSLVLSSDGRIRKDLEPTLQLIVKRCNGLPLALTTVARSMKGESRLNLWQNALNELRRGQNSHDLFSTLKFSYDRLRDPDEQQCFLYCALYQEDFKIPKHELIEHWIEEGFIAEMESRHYMICKGHAILKKLEDRCLLESIRNDEDDADDRRESVRMHDLLRDMALRIAHSNFLVRAGIELNELPKENEWRKDVQKVSLRNCFIEEIPSAMPIPMGSMLTTLLLSYNKFRAIPESFFENTLELKILDLSGNDMLKVLPKSVSKLVKLSSLLLRGCKNLNRLPRLSELQALTKLDFSQTGVTLFPQDLGRLENLKYLDLIEISLLEVFTFLMWEKLLLEILPTLTKLQHLGVPNIIELKGEQIGRLVKLESFVGLFPTVHEWDIFAKSRRVGLNWYHLCVGERTKWSIYPKETKSIRFSGIEFCRKSTFPILPSDVKALVIEFCKDARILNDDTSGFQDATDLQMLDISDCEGLETVFTFTCLSLNPLQHLKTLRLYKLRNLTGLFEAEGGNVNSQSLPLGTFSSLKHLSIIYCDNMKSLIPVRMLGYLKNLEDICVRHCKQMEEIISATTEVEKQLVLPKLQKLELLNMPSLKSMCSTNSVLICGSLRLLEIRECWKLKRIPLYLPQLDTSQQSLPPSPPIKWIKISRSIWESLEWNHPEAKNVLLPLCHLMEDIQGEKQ